MWLTSEHAKVSALENSLIPHIYPSIPCMAKQPEYLQLLELLTTELDKNGLVDCFGEG
jgi:hypothetical protein